MTVLTNTMEQISFFQNLTVAHLPKKSPAWTPKVHYHAMALILSQTNPVHARLFYFI
jgi:hypothetical protein